MIFIVAIRYGKGVIQCTQYEQMNGEFFASFVENNLDAMFMQAGKGISWLWIQHGDPSQNCAAVRGILARKGSQLLQIPPRTPDVYTIKNSFHLVKLELCRQAINFNITKETYEEFTARIIRTMMTFPEQTIDNIIDSMDNRMCLIIRGNVLHN